jgi:hypothetical protein
MRKKWPFEGISSIKYGLSIDVFQSEVPNNNRITLINITITGFSR